MTLKPNFFVIGAPKCGTTFLSHFLGLHPQIFMTAEKEPCYFNTDMQHRRVTDLASYEKLFANAEGTLARGEASVFYLYSQVAVPLLRAYSPKSKIVVCLRHPIDMVASWYAQMVFDGFELAPTIQEAWNLQPRRAVGNDIPTRCPDPAFLQYRTMCDLGEQVQRLLTHVPRDSIHFVVLDDIRTKPGDTFIRLLDFLGVPSWSPTQFEVVNPRVRARSTALSSFLRLAGSTGKVLGLSHTGLLAPLHRINRKTWQDRQSDTTFLSTLMPVFSRSIEQLREHTDLDLAEWDSWGDT